MKKFEASELLLVWLAKRQMLGCTQDSLDLCGAKVRIECMYQTQELELHEVQRDEFKTGLDHTSCENHAQLMSGWTFVSGEMRGLEKLEKGSGIFIFELFSSGHARLK